MMWGENLRWDGFRDERGRYCTPEAFEARTGLITAGSHPGEQFPPVIRAAENLPGRYFDDSH